MKENGYEDPRKVEDGEDRALSELLREANGEMPTKDGLSLRDAVMRRVRNGDVQPRYLPTRSFRFPVATAACLVLCLVAAFAAKNGLLTRFGAKSADSAAPETYQLTTNTEEPTDEKKTGGAFLSDASFGAMPAAFDHDGADEETEEAEECTVADEADGAPVQEAQASVLQDTGSTGGALVRESKRAVTSTANSSDTSGENGAVLLSLPEDNTTEQFAVCDGVPLLEESAPDSEETVEESVTTDDVISENGASAGETSCRYAMRGPGTSSAAKAGGGASPALSADVAERMEKARAILTGLGAENVEPIRAETIAAHGEDVYCAFFDAIEDRADFAALYAEEVFTAYCETGEDALTVAG